MDVNEEYREMLREEILKRIDETIRKRGLSKYRVAKCIGMSKVSVCDWFRKRCIPKTPVIIPLSRMLDVSPEYLLCADLYDELQRSTNGKTKIKQGGQGADLR